MATSIETLSQGVQRVLAPAMRECDRNVASCVSAQTDLTAHIDRLSHELEILIAAMPEVSAAACARRVETIKGRIEIVAARVASAKERVRVVHAEAFAMRRANLVRVAAEPMDELPENRDEMYRNASGPAESGDDDDAANNAAAKRIDEPKRAASSPSCA